jgi:hypothetical protein
LIVSDTSISPPVTESIDATEAITSESSPPYQRVRAVVRDAPFWNDTRPARAADDLVRELNGGAAAGERAERRISRGPSSAGSHIRWSCCPSPGSSWYHNGNRTCHA